MFDPRFASENDSFAWTVIKMGGLQAQMIVVRDSFHVRFIGGNHDITHQVASFVRRGYIQVVTDRNNRISVVFPGEYGWKIPAKPERPLRRRLI